MNRLSNAVKEIRKLVPHNYIEISEVFRVYTTGDTEHKFIGVTYAKIGVSPTTIMRDDLEELVHDLSNTVIKNEAASLESNKDGI